MESKILDFLKVTPEERLRLSDKTKQYVKLLDGLQLVYSQSPDSSNKEKLAISIVELNNQLLRYLKTEKMGIYGEVKKPIEPKPKGSEPKTSEPSPSQPKPPMPPPPMPKPPMPKPPMPTPTSQPKPPMPTPPSQPKPPSQAEPKDKIKELKEKIKQLDMTIKGLSILAQKGNEDAQKTVAGLKILKRKLEEDLSKLLQAASEPSNNDHKSQEPKTEPSHSNKYSNIVLKYQYPNYKKKLDLIKYYTVDTSKEIKIGGLGESGYELLGESGITNLAITKTQLDKILEGKTIELSGALVSLADKIEPPTINILQSIEEFIDNLNKKFGDKDNEYLGTKGSSYYKIIQRNFSSRSAYGFIALRDNPNKGERAGDLLKAASWEAPARIARGNILKGNAQYDRYGVAYIR